MTFALARESLTPQLLAELRPLILRNHAATGSKAPLDPNWDLFAQYDQGGAMVVVVARDGERAVGYCCQVMNEHQLYGERWASCVAIYLEPEYRARAQFLICYMQATAKEAGADVITFNLPWSQWRSTKFFERMGYQRQEVVMARRIG